MLRSSEWHLACDGIRRSFDYSRARRSQETLKGKLMLKDITAGLPSAVAAVDAAYWGPGAAYGVGVTVVFNLQGELLGCTYAYGPVCVPYVPGLLAFREMQLMAPALAAALKAFSVGLIMVDGHGVAHPRGFGIASHIGLSFGKPSIGVAKRRLFGSVARCTYGECLYDDKGAVIGAVLRSPTGSPIYVSQGYGVSLDSAVKVVEMQWVEGLRLPYALQAADAASKDLRDILKARRTDRLAVGTCHDVSGLGRLKQVLLRIKAQRDHMA